MIRYRSIWIIALFGISLWMTLPHYTATASQDQMLTPTPTAGLVSTPIAELSKAQYPGMVIGMLAIVSIIFIGAVVLAKRR